MKGKYILGFIVLFVLISLFYAAPGEDPWLDIFSQQFLPTMAGLVAVSLLAGTGIAVVVYMFAQLVGQDSLKASAKLELFEIFYSAFLFVFIFSMFYTFDDVMKATVTLMYPQDTITEVVGYTMTQPDSYGAIPEHFRYPKWFLSSLFDEAVYFNREIYESYVITGLLGDIYMSFDLFWEQRSFINYNPIRGFVNQGNLVKMEVFDMVVKVAILAKFQELFLHVFISGFFPVLLTAGFILRTFSTTRKLGGLLMAIALSIYFVFPLSYIFAGAVYAHANGIGEFKIDKQTAEDMLNPLKGAGISVKDDGELGIDNTDFNDLESVGANVDTIESLIKKNGVTDVCELLKKHDEEESEDLDKTGVSVESWIDEFQGKGVTLWGTNEAYFDKPARLIFFSMFFSFFGLMATVATIRSVSAILGGDLEIAGLTHLI